MKSPAMNISHYTKCIRYFLNVQHPSHATSNVPYRIYIYVVIYSYTKIHKLALTRQGKSWVFYSSADKRQSLQWLNAVHISVYFLTLWNSLLPLFSSWKASSWMDEASISEAFLTTRKFPWSNFITYFDREQRDCF